MTPTRIFYAAAGPADLHQSHRHWRTGTHNPTEVSQTFSGQIQDFCRDIGAEGYFISVHPNPGIVHDGEFTMEHRPKRPARGGQYHLEEIRYGIGLLRTAKQWGADVALLDSGITHYFVMGLFRAAGIQVVPILHNTLWPAGYRPTDKISRALDFLNRRFWREQPQSVIGVSPECLRQVEALAPQRDYAMHEIRAQFDRGYFERIGAPPKHGDGPFRVMFIGRVNRIKGVLDIPAMARRIEDRSPGLVGWEICGSGPDLDELRAEIARLGVDHVVTARGWTSLEEVTQVYNRSHAAIVPTRSSFEEGLAMTAAEAILAGRPLITNPVVPALEVLRPAAIAGRTDDPDSHADAVEKLARDRVLYERLRHACPAVAGPFYDRRNGLRNMLRVALGITPVEAPALAGAYAEAA